MKCNHMGIPAAPEDRSYLGGVLGIQINGALQPISSEGIVDLEIDAQAAKDYAAQAEESAQAAEESATQAEENVRAAAETATREAQTAAADAEAAATAAAQSAQAAQTAAERDIPAAVTDWLGEHITNPSNPPLDTSLSVEGAAADAKAAGEASRYAAKNLEAGTMAKANGTHNGVIFTWSADKSSCVLTGTSSATTAAVNSLFRASGTYQEGFPSGLQKGKRYWVDYVTSNQEVPLEFVCYRSTGSGYAQQTTAFVGPGFLEIPADISGMIIRIRALQGAGISPDSPATISRCSIFSAATPEALEDMILQAPTGVRVMQYNIGKLNMGRQTPGLPSDVFEQKIKNYKKLFCDVEADVVGMQEYPIYCNQGQTISTREVLFQPLYESRIISNAERAVFTHYQVHSSGTGSFVADWADAPRDDKGNLYQRYYAYIIAEVSGRRVLFMSTALGGAVNPIAMQDRQEALKVLLGLDLVGRYDYAIITADLNNGGDFYPTNPNTWEPTEPYAWDLDGEALLAVAKSLGWNFAMGSYYPWEQTYNDAGRPDIYGGAGRPGWRPCIDNILYKDNGKVRFKGFKVLPDVTADGGRLLYSDHYPVYGDFELL